MPGRMIAALRTLNATRRPEDSVPLRLAVLASVMTGLLALTVQRAIPLSTAALVAVALPLAYWVSYRRRAKDNWHIKIVLTLAALIALFRFLGQLTGLATLDEVRFPLADLFLWVQVIHGFDLPQRKDLHFSLGSSLALMGVAGSLSQDLTFGLLLGLYALCAISALYLGHRSALRDGTVGGFAPRSTERDSPRETPRAIGRAVVATLVAGALLFLVIPQSQGARSFALPFSLGGAGGVFTGGSPVNPGFSPEGADQRSGGQSFHGFGSRMDLRVRGDLPDDVVLRVRASAPAMWRGPIFDTYDGAAWLGDEGEGIPLLGSSPHQYPLQHRGTGPRAQVTQTFYIEAELPNAVFAAEHPNQIWYDGSLRVDRLGALRTDSTLTPGAVYSVVSSRGAASGVQLRDAPSDVPEHLAPYLSLPETLPRRVHELALRITRGTTNNYDKVRAIEAYLRDNFRYRIDSPIAPPGRDAVDHFLFDTDVGFCEQFAAATAVMLRSLGVPTRVVAGYTTGTRNVFTGLYEVKASDAHSWVEVWFPTYGWYEFDPTFDIPPADVRLSDTLPLAQVVRVLGSAIRSVMGAGLQTQAVVSFTGVALLGLLLAWAAHGRRRARGREAGGVWASGPLADAFLGLETALREAGSPRSLAETARETLLRAARLSGIPVHAAPRAIEHELYGRDRADPGEVREAVIELDRVAGVLGRGDDAR